MVPVVDVLPVAPVLVEPVPVALLDVGMPALLRARVPVAAGVLPPICCWSTALVCILASAVGW
jgi:hypothetical protein